MKRSRRLLVLIAILVVGVGVSAWVNIPPWLVRRRASTHYRQGLEYVRKGALDSALAEWRIATRVDPDYPEPYHKLGEVLLNIAERPDLASGIYAHLVAIQPNGPHIYCNLAKALALRNETAEAREYARLAVKAEPNCALAHNIMGFILVNDQQVSAGLKEMERACQLAPRDETFALILAQAYLDTSNYAGAERLLTGVVRQSPDNIRARYLLGWTYTRGPRGPDSVGKALTHFREAARLQPDNADNYSEWGKLLLQSGQAAEAVKVLSKAWELNPRLAQVAHNLAAAYRVLGDEKRAQPMEQQERLLLDRITRMRVLQKKVKANPKDIPTVLELAEVELQDGNLTDSLRYIQGVLAHYPADRRALGLLARLYAVGGKPKLAEEVREHLRTLPGTGAPPGGGAPSTPP